MTHDHTGEDRLRYIGMDEAACAELKEFNTVADSAIDDILARFYEHLHGWPELSQILGDEANTARAKGLQRRHIVENVLGGDYGPQFFQQADAVGRTHERIGLHPRWYFGAYCITLNGLLRQAIQRHRKNPEKLYAVLSALNKAVFMDMDVAVSVIHEVGVDKAKAFGDRAQQFAEALEQTISQMGNAAHGLNGTASSMDANATSTSERAAVVTSAAEEASTGVQTAAAAAEELSASISEIST